MSSESGDSNHDRIVITTTTMKLIMKTTVEQWCSIHWWQSKPFIVGFCCGIWMHRNISLISWRFFAWFSHRTVWKFRPIRPIPEVVLGAPMCSSAFSRAVWSLEISKGRRSWWWCHKLVGGLVAIFYFPINIGFLIIPIDFHIFQRGSNHQPVRILKTNHSMNVFLDTAWQFFYTAMAKRWSIDRWFVGWFPASPTKN